jgi:dynein heavy chain
VVPVAWLLLYTYLPACQGQKLVYLRGISCTPTYLPPCRSLFEKDKLLFAFSLATSVGVAEGRVQRAQLRFLLTGEVPCSFEC